MGSALVTEEGQVAANTATIEERSGRPKMQQRQHWRTRVTTMVECDFLPQLGQNTNYPKAMATGGTARRMAKASLKIPLVPGRVIRTRSQESAIGGRATTSGSGSDGVACSAVVHSWRIIACHSCCCLVPVDCKLTFGRGKFASSFSGKK